MSPFKTLSSVGELCGKIVTERGPALHEGSERALKGWTPPVTSLNNMHNCEASEASVALCVVSGKKSTGCLCVCLCVCDSVSLDNGLMDFDNFFLNGSYQLCADGTFFDF